MPTTGTPSHLRPEVAEALAWGRPVVALETTLIAHGLPRPDNLAFAHELEAIVRDAGGVPATIGVIRGQPLIGMSDSELEEIALGADVPKLSVRDLGRPPRVAATAQRRWPALRCWQIGLAFACSRRAVWAACTARRAKHGTSPPTWRR